MPRIAVVGKGGSGKTTLVATLSRLAARHGETVIAVDGDPNPNLAAALGFPPETRASFTPLGTRTAATGVATSFGDRATLKEVVDDTAIRTADGVRLVVGVGVQDAGVG